MTNKSLTAIILIISLTTVRCNNSIDCTKYRNGKFYTYSPVTKDKILIERKDSIQIETNTKSGLVAKSKILWTSPCEYEIVGSTTNKVKKDGVDSFFSITPIKVSITNSEKDYYIFKIVVDSANKHLEYSDTIRIR